jgi:hypothetical protein
LHGRTVRVASDRSRSLTPRLMHSHRRSDELTEVFAIGDEALHDRYWLTSAVRL